MNYFNRYLELRDGFQNQVRKGVFFPELLDVTYPRGVNPEGLSVTTEGDSWFYAKELVANPSYSLHKGEDIIIGTTEVVFIGIDGAKHQVEPDILDLYWLSELLDKCK